MATSAGEGMLEPDPEEAALETRIRASRKPSLDGTKAVYDLRFDVDFSNPRRTAEAISRVVWDEDVKSWWSVKDGSPVCTPTGTVELWVPSQHNRRIAKAVQDFQEDLRDHELGGALSDYLASREDHSTDWGAIILMGPLWAYLLQAHGNNVERTAELAKLFSTMADHITIVGDS